MLKQFDFVSCKCADTLIFCFDFVRSTNLSTYELRYALLLRNLTT